MIITSFQVELIEEKDRVGNSFERNWKVPVKLKNFVEYTMDVASASPRRYFFEVRPALAIFNHSSVQFDDDDVLYALEFGLIF